VNPERIRFAPTRVPQKDLSRTCLLTHNSLSELKRGVNTLSR
jgi:hypothetical protein